MRLPQYSNPQFLSDNTRTVSRRALQLEDDANDDAAPGEEADEMMLETKDVEDLHVKLDKIISKRLKLKRSLESSDETSSSKRHKRQRDEGEGKPAEHRDSEPVVFRLVSKWLPPRTIYLNSKPSEVIPVGEPPCEDTDQELRERVYRSTISAVDLEQIKRGFATTNERKLQRVLHTASPSHITAAPLLLLEIPRVTAIPPLWANPRIHIPPKPSPHQLNKSVCCPISFVGPTHAGDSPKMGRRRRGKPKNKNRLFP